MTGEFPPTGAGMPTDDDVRGTRDYLILHQRKHSTREVYKELLANGFTISPATTGRAIQRIEGKKPGPKPKPSPTEKAEKRNTSRRTRRKPVDEEKVDLAKMLMPEGEIAKTVELAALLAAESTSTALAIRENRTRMALNIVIMEQMAARPALMLLDMRSTAALVDALTVASKLSGGPAIDITVSNPARDQPHGAVNGVSANGQDVSPNGHAMKDITPVKSSLSDELEAFRRRRAMENGQRA